MVIDRDGVLPGGRKKKTFVEKVFGFGFGLRELVGSGKFPDLIDRNGDRLVDLIVGQKVND